MALLLVRLLNLHKVIVLGAHIVSIGNAGTFNEVYTTGLIAALLVLLLL